MTSTSHIQSNEGGHYTLMAVIPDEVFSSVNDLPETTAVSPSNEAAATEPRRLLSPKQVSDLCGLHVEVVRRAIRDGELPASRLRGKLRVRPEDFDAWVNQNAVSAEDWA